MQCSSCVTFNLGPSITHTAVALAMRVGSSLANTTVVLSNEPCSFCVKALIQAGVSEILYLKRDDKEKAYKEKAYKEKAYKEELQQRENQKIHSHVMMAKTSYYANGLSQEVCGNCSFLINFINCGRNVRHLITSTTRKRLTRKRLTRKSFDKEKTIRYILRL